ncbi:hypothetical protein JN01_0551 [Entomoplasma freundtii]|uniref:Uncharacterized protein n=1 Tax=Entomoplasma freundtii TaxID=74700 RepID=A0A2K8NTA2_9MOLU|nr:hypothetical protein [Entomoplasma freundtii]ATZ16408.1 hypothetical protein EFREU_v1c03820 [Entomoplasma freundtii]TDY56553.1 hypothetical protein JN01_0551 [Entomoplasma freundtii]
MANVFKPDSNFPSSPSPDESLENRETNNSNIPWTPNQQFYNSEFQQQAAPYPHHQYQQPLPLPQQSPNQNQPRKLKPNFSKTDLRAVEVPREISKEIRGEKWRTTGLIALGSIFMATSLFFLLFYYLVPIENDMRWKIPKQFIPHPAPMIVLAVFGLLFFLWGVIDLTHLKIDVKNYKGDILMGYERVPYFILRNYKALLSRPIYLNWIAFNLYFWGGIAIGVFYLIRTLSKNKLPMNTEIIIMLTILVLMLVIQIVSLFKTRARKGRICAYYGYELVPPDVELTIKKRANRRCLIIFFSALSVVLFAVIIPWMIVRKNKGKKIIPFV